MPLYQENDGLILEPNVDWKTRIDFLSKLQRNAQEPETMDFVLINIESIAKQLVDLRSQFGSMAFQLVKSLLAAE